MKDKIHMVVTIDAEKSLDKIQNPFMIKTISNVGIEGAYLHVIKAMHDKPTGSIILNGQKQSISLKIKKKAGISAFIILI